jgi:hypothetical protein
VDGDRPAGRKRTELEQLDADDRRRVPEGAVVATPDTLYMGFGFEGISTPAARTTVMRRSMDYLLR